ncbi:MAG: hypothetical protein KAQ63_02380 [Candidatus Moranbacteria bacterium]|nr:hypothetical protein [Candidatus Moranbacteria bacterium]
MKLFEKEIPEKELELGTCPVKPHHINTNNHFYNLYRNATDDAECAARQLVIFAQDAQKNRLGCWPTFTWNEIKKFLSKDFLVFEELLQANLITDRKGFYGFTEKFILACLGISSWTERVSNAMRVTLTKDLELTSLDKYEQVIAPPGRYVLKGIANPMQSSDNYFIKWFVILIEGVGLAGMADSSWIEKGLGVVIERY